MSTILYRGYKITRDGNGNCTVKTPKGNTWEEIAPTKHTAVRWIDAHLIENHPQLAGRTVVATPKIVRSKFRYRIGEKVNVANGNKGEVRHRYIYTGCKCYLVDVGLHKSPFHTGEICLAPFSEQALDNHNRVEETL